MEFNSALLHLPNSLPSSATFSATLLSPPVHLPRRHLCIPEAYMLLPLVGRPAMFNSCPPLLHPHHCRGAYASLLQLGFSANPQFSISTPSFLSSPMAFGSDASSVDTDDMFDDLFKKHGKVIYRSSDHKSAAAEIDDDAESLSFAVAAAKVASEVKAGDIKVLFVKPLVYWTRFFIIATAFSRPQIDAIGTKIRDMAENKYGRFAAGDSKSFGRGPAGESKPNSWTLLDFGDVVVHIFLPQQRAFYNLEEFYGNATVIELPFQS
ncbi:protein Iojap, chloroplastic-like [Coffea arabica]|uniref:Protein Iojap, chloroplastic n=1 Tax=Coffea arabica TaxID=13443 RepID=A0A6P6SAS1_COFAR|nr:protein Iojap, chloroplastic-like [Coffea arabica]